jgi:hypothetical protein
VTKVRIPKSEKGRQSHKNQGRDFPQRLLVLSKTIPHTGASIASIERAISRIEPAAAAEIP